MSKSKPEPRMSSPRSPAARARCDRVGDARLGVRVLAADVEVALRRAGREGGDGHRLDGGERVALEQHAVLERARLGLVGVAHEVVRLGRPGSRPRPTCGRSGRRRRRDRGAATSVTSAMTRVRTHLERLGEGGVAAVGAVVVERGRVDDADAAEEASRHAVDRRRIAEGLSRRVHGPPRAVDDADGIDRCERERRGRLAGEREQGRRRAIAQPQARTAQPRRRGRPVPAPRPARRPVSGPRRSPPRRPAGTRCRRRRGRRPAVAESWRRARRTSRRHRPRPGRRPVACRCS